MIGKLKLNFEYFRVIAVNLVLQTHSWQISVESRWLSCVDWKQIFRCFLQKLSIIDLLAD